MAEEQNTIQQLQNELQRLREENIQLKRFWLESNAVQISDGVEWDSSGFLGAIFENAQPVIYMLDAEGRFLVSEGKGLEALIHDFFHLSSFESEIHQCGYQVLFFLTSMAPSTSISINKMSET